MSVNPLSPLAVVAAALWLGVAPTSLAAADANRTGDLAQPTASPTPTTDAAADDVDVSALRYFARNGDSVRLNLEISRLQALHPDWIPPTDPANAPEPPDRELNAIWQLYSQDHFPEARAAIAARKEREPDWQPPADLLTMLDRGEARRRLTNAYNLKQYARVVETAANAPDLTSCSEINVIWMVAESFVRTDRAKRGEDAYDYVLKTCGGGDIHRATLQKAAELLPYAAVQRLIADEPLAAEGTGEFASLKDDLARRFVGDANADAKLVVDASYVERLKSMADQGGSVDDVLNYAWYVWLHGRSPAAQAYFERARTLQDSASAAVGLTLTLLAKQQYAEGEAVMYGWRQTSKDTMATYLAAAANLLSQNPPVTIDAAVMQRMAEAVLTERDAVAAQQFGWYARQAHQLETASDWFSTALSWSADDEPSAFGLTLTRLDLGDVATATRLRDAWADRSPRIAALGRAPAPAPAPGRKAAIEGDVAVTGSIPAAGQAPVGPAVSTVAFSAPMSAKAQPKGRRVEASASTPRSAGAGNCKGVTAPSQSQPTSDAAALRLGWCYMDLKQPASALRSFEAVAARASASRREEASYGRALALLRLGLTDEAAIAATGTPMSPERAATLQTIILANRAIAAFDGNRFREAILYLDQRAALAPEPLDLMTLRGHAYVKLGSMEEAKRVFSALAAIGNPEGPRGLNMIRDQHG
ncbi:cellulose synthase [Pleomorphomonas sp. PLEO]|uniref:cellulose synthase n=1 Tax=Pleomorphomonas sp. PLEO TaxID=3239306 RepID=UPI00351E63C2